MIIQSVRDILRQTHSDHFYLMHLSYGGRSRKALWDFAKQHNLIGLSHSGIDNRWDQVSSGKKLSLSPTWRRQFEQFVSMEEGECVLVASGQFEILGVALAKEPYKYRRELDDDFFSHVRNVHWLVTYEWDRARPVRIPGFDNTIARVDENSPRWNLANARLRILRPVPRKLKEAGEQRERELKEKYGQGGEGMEHKRLKKWVLDHPENVVDGPILRYHEEYRFESGDFADIVFDLPGGKYCVVEIETDVPMPGAYQALKYKTLKCAELRTDVKSASVEAVLVARVIPQDLEFCKIYGIRFVRMPLSREDHRGLERSIINYLRG